MRRFLYTLVILFAGTAVGCAIKSGRPREISAAEFKTELTSINSAYYSQFIGTTEKRAYVERVSLVEAPSLAGFGPTVVVYCTDLNEFSSEERESLRRGQIPWTQVPGYHSK